MAEQAACIMGICFHVVLPTNAFPILQFLLGEIFDIFIQPYRVQEMDVYLHGDTFV